MFLKRLIIRNFRSIEFADIPFDQGMNVIVGKNNSGKSNIIKALDLVLGENTPTYQKNENISENDFFTEKIDKSDTIVIWCELHKCHDEDIDWDNVNDSDVRSFLYTFDFKFLLDQSNFEKELRFAFNVNLDNLSSSSYGKSDENGGFKEYIKSVSDFKEKFNNIEKVAFAFITRREEFMIKDLRLFVFDSKAFGWKMIFKPILRNFFLQSAIIPSFRDPSSQLRINQWSWYGKLLKKLIDRLENKDNLFDAFSKVQTEANKIFSELEQFVSQTNLHISFPGTNVSFQFNADVNVDIYKGAHIYIDDGFKSSIFDKGSGIQSSVIIGLFAYYCNYINTNNTTCSLLCVEEPELYLHPHACRTIRHNLKQFLMGGKNQVVITTHSPELINTVDGNTNIISVTKPIIKSDITIAKTKDFKEFFIDNNQNEIFFSDKVILCEGYDKYIIKWIAEECWKDSSNSLDSKNISVINVWGKNEFVRIYKKIKEIKKEVFIIADFDFFIRDKDCPDGKNLCIEDLPDDFFNQESNDTTQCQEILARIKQLRLLIKKESSELFYSAKKIDEFKVFSQFTILKEIISKLQDYHILLLPGEIEDLYLRDGQLQKLQLKKIYEISKEINTGTSIKTIFNGSVIEGFLSKIIGIPEV
jgi:predicted ATP-dependent endonuclease of OLD family